MGIACRSLWPLCCGSTERRFSSINAANVLRRQPRLLVSRPSKLRASRLSLRDTSGRSPRAIPPASSTSSSCVYRTIELGGAKPLLLASSCCLLRAACCVLPAACCLPPTACRLLPAACCLLPAACCMHMRDFANPPLQAEYVVQKLTLVGLTVFFLPGSLEQLLLGLIICFAYTMLVAFLVPFSSHVDNLLSVVSQFGLFVAMLQAVVIKYGSATVSDTVINILVGATLVPAFLAIILGVQVVFNELEIDPMGGVLRSIWPRRPAFSAPISIHHVAKNEEMYRPTTISATATPVEVPEQRLEVREWEED